MLFTKLESDIRDTLLEQLGMSSILGQAKC